ncbi:hypothetical protein [Tardiphaga sp. 619_E2_N8_5]|uniref:hypothetical protein n=1 Tax=unclassified Tardiphaga TaxID=2631404 RepID=UPI003F264787
MGSTKPKPYYEIVRFERVMLVGASMAAIFVGALIHVLGGQMPIARGGALSLINSPRGKQGMRKWGDASGRDVHDAY